MIFDTLSNLELYIPVIPKLKVVADAMDHDEVYDLKPGHYTTPDKDVSYDVIEYNTSISEKPFVFHKRHSIVEIVLSGKELISTSWRELASSAEGYNKDTDECFFNGEPLCAIQGAQGRFTAFLPGEPYKSGTAEVVSDFVKKVIFTISE